MAGGQLLWQLSHQCINLLMKGMAAEAKKKKIAVVTLMPGFMRTERVMRIMTTDKAEKAVWLRRTANRRNTSAARSPRWRPIPRLARSPARFTSSPISPRNTDSPTWTASKFLDSTRSNNLLPLLLLSPLSCLALDVAAHHVAIPDGGAINVVREDPQRPALLFAGSEQAVYVSFDDGDHWQSLRLTCPRRRYATRHQRRRPGRRDRRPLVLDSRRRHAAAAGACRDVCRQRPSVRAASSLAFSLEQEH